MGDVSEVTQQVKVPANTGVEGFLHAIREIVRKPQVLRIVIEASGMVSYTRRTNDEIEDNVGINFSHLEPYAIIRNSETKELTYPLSLSAPEVLVAMMDELASNGYSPICFVIGMDSSIWNWFYLSAGIELQHKRSLLGYPIYEDKDIPATALVLCAGIGDSKALIDTRLSVKIEMLISSVLREEMDVL